MRFGNEKRLIGSCLVTLLAASLAVTTGCSSGGGQAKEKSKAVESIGSLADQLKMAPQQVDAVNAAIDQLQAGGDTKAAFGQYTKAVADIEESGNKAKARREAMQKNRRAYIAKWQADVEQIQNPEVRAALAERKQAVAANFDTIRDAASGVREAYLPYLKNLQEIQQGLAIDLNPSGVAALQKPLTTAKSDGQTLKEKVAALEAELRTIAGEMSPSAASKK